jgi:hypothetical protein
MGITMMSASLCGKMRMNTDDELHADCFALILLELGLISIIELSKFRGTTGKYVRRV